MKEKFTPTTQYIKEALDYSPDTGKFKWRTRPLSHFKNSRGMNIFNSTYSGKEAGTLSIRRNGRAKYLTVSLTKGFLYYCHRLAFIWMGIEIPEGMQIDHINHNGTDNRFDNLQIVTNQENGMNAVRRSGKNSHLPRGCEPRENGKFTASLKHGGVHYNLGTHNTPEQCSVARRKKAEELGVKNFLQ